MLDATGVVTNVIQVAPREIPSGAHVIPDGLRVAPGWRWAAGRFTPPDAPALPPPTRNLEAEYAERVDGVSTMAGLRQVLRDYFEERASTN